MTLDITQWAEQYAQWQQAQNTPVVAVLSMLAIFIGGIFLFVFLLLRFGRFLVKLPEAAGSAIAVVYAIGIIVCEFACMSHAPALPPEPAPFIQIVEKGYGITSLSCGEDDLTKDGWHSCTAVKDRRLLELKLDKENTRVTVYDRTTGERLETAE